MVAGGGEENGAGQRLVAFLGEPDRQRRVPSQPLRQAADEPLVDVLDDDDRRRKVPRQGLQQRGKRGRAARGRADGDQRLP